MVAVSNKDKLERSFHVWFMVLRNDDGGGLDQEQWTLNDDANPNGSLEWLIFS